MSDWFYGRSLTAGFSRVLSDEMVESCAGFVHVEWPAG